MSDIHMTYKQAAILWNQFRSANDATLSYALSQDVVPFVHKEIGFASGEQERDVVAFLRAMADALDAGIPEMYPEKKAKAKA